MLFLQTRSTAKSLSTKTVILSTCFCLRKSQRCFGLSHQIPRRTFQRMKSNSRSSLILRAKRFAVSARSTLSWARYESLNARRSALLHLSSESGFVFRLMPVCLVVFSRCVLSALVFVLHPESLMTSGACLKSGSKSSYCPG